MSWRDAEIITIGATPDSAETTGHLVRVILPGSKGLNLRSNNEEFVVESVSYSPHYNGLAYRGCRCEGAIGANQDVKTIFALDSLIEIPVESKLGWYNPESGGVKAETV